MKCPKCKHEWDELDAILSEPDLLDFDQIYADYPRKMGKTAGLKKARAQVKTLSAWADLRVAVSNFRRYHELRGTEPQYIPYFSTFMTSWRDWIELPEDPATPPSSPKAREKSKHWRSQAQRIADGEL